MKLSYKKRMKCRFRMAGFFVLCAVLTGCRSREAEFLAEGMKEAKAEAEILEKESEAELSLEKETAEAVITEAEQPQVPAEIYVDVCGAVAEPGVFKLEEGSRVFQAIEAAGGYLPEAAEEYVNRAGFLSDGQQIYIPTEEEAQDASFSGTESTGGEKTAEGADTSGGRVNLNTADEAGLMTLTGIGATRAQAIISYREENGPFTSIEEIMNVQGIKEGTFTKIKDKIVVG